MNKLAVSSPQIHKLEGKDLKRWWQLGDRIFSLPSQRSRRQPDKFQNVVIRSMLLFLMQLPFAMALCYHAIGAQAIKVIGLAGAAGLVMLFLLWKEVERHARFLQRVDYSDDEITLISLNLKRKVRWSEISELYPTQNNEFYVLDCRNGERFFLPSELTGCDQLVKQISAKLERPTTPYTQAFIFPSGFTEQIPLMCFAILLATSFGAIKSLIYGVAISNSTVVVVTLTSLVCVLLWRMSLQRLVSLVRLGPSSISLATRSGVSVVPLAGLSKVVRALPGLFVIKACGNWFVVFADSSGEFAPLNAALIEQKDKLRRLT